MYRFLLRLMLAVTVIPVTAAAGSYWGTGNDKYDVMGHLTVREHDGEQIFRFNVLVTGFKPDSVVISGPATIELTTDSAGATDESTADRVAYRFRGARAFDDTIPPSRYRWGMVSAYGMDGPDSVRVWGNVRLWPYTVRINFSYLGSGYGEGRIPGQSTRHALLYSGEFGFDVPTPKFDFFSQISGFGNFSGRWAFTHSETVPIGARLLPFGRTDFYPTATAAVQFSTLNILRNDIGYNRKQWGGQFGLRIDTPFERFYYAYSTNLGGYHRAGIFFKVSSSGFAQVGSRYEYIKFEDVEMFRLQVQLEGLGWGDGESEELERENNRPWWHKGLAMGAIAPFAVVAYPIFWLSRLIGAD